MTSHVLNPWGGWVGGWVENLNYLYQELPVEAVSDLYQPPCKYTVETNFTDAVYTFLVQICL